MLVQLFFRQYGSGKPIIILHGLLGSLDNWHSLSTRFGEHYHVFAADQRNHGRSPHSDVMSYEAMAEDLHEFLHSRGISSTALIGHSMGGKTAMEFALRHPSLLKALIVVDIAPRGYGPHHDHIFEA
ncbi:MAG: alpha/beta fold hydrolase, partial [Ignavibacteriales bacterium]|nr:alpha/beta fold hydrolase [Ignavibacteriales bacterium]